MSYNKKLKEIRKKLNLSQSEMGDKLNIKQSYYSALERGVKTIPTSVIECLFKSVGVYPGWFFNSIGNMFSSSNIPPEISVLKRKSDEEIIDSSIKIEKFRKAAKRLKNKLQNQFTEDGVGYLELMEKLRRFEELTELLKEVLENYVSVYNPELVNPRGDFLNPNPELPEYNEYKNSVINHLKIILPYESSIDLINKSIHNFLKEIKPLDTDDIIYL